MFPLCANAWYIIHSKHFFSYYLLFILRSMSIHNRKLLSHRIDKGINLIITTTEHTSKPEKRN